MRILIAAVKSECIVTAILDAKHPTVKPILLAALLAAGTLPAGAFPTIGSTVSVTPEAGTTDGDHTGRLTLDGTDSFWWFCVQPDGSEGPGTVPGGMYDATVVSLEQGWGNQYTTRATDGGTLGLSKQATIIGYLLDTYLSWEDAGMSGRFNEITGDLENDNSVDFFNAYDATARYVASMFPYSTSGTGLDRVDFTTFTPGNPYSSGSAERQELFNTIVADVIAKDAVDYFDSYNVSGGYAIVNTNEDHSVTNTAQDVVIILTPPVPEPSSAFLAMGAGLTLFRRRR